jgi:DNA-damage-inducible protein J
MATDALVSARIDKQLKEDAVAVLAEMGLSISDGIRLFLIRVVQERALPFPLSANTPNAETRAAMEEARSGALRSFASVAEMNAALDA